MERGEKSQPQTKTVETHDGKVKEVELIDDGKVKPSVVTEEPIGAFDPTPHLR